MIRHPAIDLLGVCVGCISEEEVGELILDFMHEAL